MWTITLYDDDYWTLENALGTAKSEYERISDSDNEHIRKQFQRQAIETEALLIKIRDAWDH